MTLPPAIGWDWWLPTDYSVHGRQIDVLWNWVFWITSVVGIAVLVTLAWFCVKYRRRGDRTKGIFSHGNTRLEMIWTLIPAVILLFISFFSKRVWDNYRYNPDKDQDTAKILVIGQQFKWNVVYPGPDNKLGRYLLYPKTTDLKWPDNPPGDDNPYVFPAGVPGPAYLPEAEARRVLNDFIESKNPLGKDFSDPAGQDDDWKGALARPVYLPKDRPVEIDLSSRDVIHDFFSPNFRVKLDAVPGTRGQIFFRATTSSAQLEKPSRHPYKLDDLANLISAPNAPEFQLVVSPDAPMPEGVKQEETSDGKRYYREIQGKPNAQGKKPKPKKETVAREGVISSQMIDDLRSAGFTEVLAFQPYYWDVVCEQLCGSGHYTMRGQIVVLEQAEYKRRFETPADSTAAATGEAAPGPTAPASASAAAR